MGIRVTWLFAVTCFLVSCLASYLLARYALKLKLVAIPGGHRQHSVDTPVVGGLAICFGLVFGWLGLSSPTTGLIFCLTLICLLGVIDDIYALPSWSRFIAQGAITYLMIKLTGVQLLSLGTLFANQELLLGAWSMPVTIFATIGVINAINMSDGLDGLAGSLTLLVLLALFYISGFESLLIIVSLMSVAGFLVWNLRIKRVRAYIFMGDAGSMMLGLLLSFLLISYSQMSSGFMPVTALWLLALPLMDAVAVLLVRPLRGKSPFQADRLHYHHQLQDKGLGVNLTLLLVLLSQVIFIVTGLLLWLNNVNENLQLAFFLCLFLAYAIRLYKFSAKEQRATNTAQ